MTWFEKIKSMNESELAEVIVQQGLIDDFCRGDCGIDDDCTHPVECCVHWLNTEIQTCRVCGCTQDKACLGGCYWVETDLCSQCADAEILRLSKVVTDIATERRGAQ